MANQKNIACSMKTDTMEIIHNFSKENFLNHPKDKILFEYDISRNLMNIKVYVTKSYKLVRITKDKNIFILDFIDFYKLITCCFFNKCNFLQRNNRLFQIKRDNRNLCVYYKNDFIFTMCNSTKHMIKDLYHIYRSIIINLKIFDHIVDKKKELSNIFAYMKKYENVFSNTLLFHEVTRNRNKTYMINVKTTYKEITLLLFLYFANKCL